ncbi:MAG TPA: prolyl oligopeptidase family serine peptidase [Candidatus Didemnitutus sp.]|nr:prolyl oligopeptidase family serine peptidase [Candidatus Didemnitutus sp.]
MVDGTLLHSEAIPVPPGAISMARRALQGEDLVRFEAVTLHDITYASDGLRIKGYLALPPGGQSTYPAIVFNRGGSGPRGALTPETAMPLIGLYASWGYVVVASNYRGVAGSEGAAEEWGAGDVRDALNLLPLLDTLPYVDHDRIGLIGGSRGGMMAYMMLAKTERFRAAVTFGAPARINAVEHSAYIRKTMVKHLPPGSVEQVEAELRSAVVWAETMSPTTPLLVLHGTGDRRVDAEHSLYLAMELQRLHRPYKLIMYDNADHVLAGRRNESNADMRWWMDRYVRDGSPLPRTGPHGA